MVVTIVNQKGGVGKTTTSINLAASIALKGRKTLLIDLDPQGNSSLSFVERHEIEESKGSIFQALVGEKTIADIAMDTAIETLKLAPATIALAKVESKLMGELDAHFRLKDAIAKVASQLKLVTSLIATETKLTSDIKALAKRSEGFAGADLPSRMLDGYGVTVVPGSQTDKKPWHFSKQNSNGWSAVPKFNGPLGAISRLSYLCRLLLRRCRKSRT